MTEPNQPPPNKPPAGEDLIADAAAEVKGMAREGMAHPSTKPILIGGAVGLVAGAVLPVVSWPLGLVAGAGFMLYKRLRP